MDTIPMGRLLRGLLAGGQARALLCDTTAIAQAARETHLASNVCTAALGRGLSAAALLSAAAEEETNSLTMTIKGGGPMGSLVVVSHGRKLKGYVDYPQTTIPLREDGKLDVRGVVGSEGRITVVRDLGLREPYVGQCGLMSGEIAEDVAYYCAMSEQKPSLCALGVLVNDVVLSSGGILVQPLPGCEESVLSALEFRAPVYADISAHLLEMPLETLFQEFFKGLNPTNLSVEALTYACDCSRAKMERVLLSLGREELEDMIDKQRGAEIICHFCRERHVFTEAELRTLLAQG